MSTAGNNTQSQDSNLGDCALLLLTNQTQEGKIAALESTREDELQQVQVDASEKMPGLISHI